MFNNFPITNIYEKPSKKSKISSQMLYGEEFKILWKSREWYKIKTNYDGYKGYITKKKFYNKLNIELKVYKLKSRIFKKIKNKFIKTNKFLYFASSVPNIEKYENFIKFDKNKWIKKNDLKKINHHEKNYIKIFKQFYNIKYLWGGKSSEGIDCSALIQIFFYYNKTFFPRDTKDQIKFCKKNKKKFLNKGDIIFWKGHVGLCIDKFNFIHAYGPKKKVVIMNTNFTLKIIKKTANLSVKKISNIEKY